jgi:5-methylcytosine-specific restriction protein A
MPNAPRQYRPAHAEQAKRQQDQRRGTGTERGYNHRWKKYRAWFLSFPCNALCGMCQQAEATIVDHVLKLSGPDDPLWFEITNLLAECGPCHRRKSVICDGGLGVARTAEGAALLERLKAVAIERAKEMEAWG